MPLKHGQSEVFLNNNIIVSKMSGAFNRTGIERYKRKVVDALESLDGKPFAMLVDNTLVEGGTPEAFEALDQFNTWMATQPLIAKAFVYNSSVLKGVMEQRLSSLHSVPTDFFSDYQSALSWLERFS